MSASGPSSPLVSLTLTVQGVSNKHCLLTSFIARSEGSGETMQISLRVSPM